MRTRLLHRQFEAPGIDAIQHVATAHALVVVHRDLATAPDTSGAMRTECALTRPSRVQGAST